MVASVGATVALGFVLLLSLTYTLPSLPAMLALGLADGDAIVKV